MHHCLRKKIDFANNKKKPACQFYNLAMNTFFHYIFSDDITINQTNIHGRIDLLWIRGKL